MPKKTKIIIAGVVVAVLAAIVLYLNLAGSGATVSDDLVKSTADNASKAEPPPPTSYVPPAKPRGMGG